MPKPKDLSTRLRDHAAELDRITNRTPDGVKMSLRPPADETRDKALADLCRAVEELLRK